MSDPRATHSLADERSPKRGIVGTAPPHAGAQPVVVPACDALPGWAAKRLGDDFDWPTTCIAGLSFLLHFGAVGAAYSDWTDVVLDDDAHTAVLVESLRPTAALPMVELPAEAATSASTEGAATPTPSRPGAVRGAPPAARVERSGSMSDGAASHLIGELARLDLVVAGALAGRGPASDGVLRSGELPRDLLEQAADAAGAVRKGLDIGSATTIAEPRGSGLHALGSTERAAPTGTGASTRPSAPAPRVDLPAPTMPDCAVSNAPSVVARLSARFRLCYQRGLTHEDPAMQGSVRLVVRVGPNGEVASVASTSVSGLSPTVVSCIADRVQGAQFDAPACGGATVIIPARFFPQPR